ncbi:AraC family transcriptional regulator [Jiella pacifica]|uniref:Helix-turn-helix domain-containing protein n=1 Tax=Jiella pacifica TaxID=2696469 RepID=A0A6N9T9U6_9HYPH|nr:AraC family transcriptional regulator [Jiella pacifica]NDW07322.1 helix-turn-helix domain-containing protein [Jiella pacifica]
MYAPYKLYALLESAKGFGLTSAQILHRLPFTERSLQEESLDSSVEHYLTACENVIRLCDDPALPLQVGQSLHLSAYGLYGFALLCGPSVRASFEFAVRYHRLATPLFEIAFDLEDDKFVWKFPDEHLVPYEPRVHRFLLFQQLAQHVTHVRDITRADRKPITVEVATKATVRPELLEQLFDCPVQFSMPATRLVYDMSIVDERPPLMNPISHTTLRESCARMLEDLRAVEGVSGRVFRVVMETPVPFPSMDEVAAKLSVTSRTLRRKLMAEQRTYSEILDEVRNALARKYLRANTFTVEDIASLLGFSDAASFRTSFKRWNGMSPSEYRNST